MPAFDSTLTVSKVYDISAGGDQASTAVALGKQGLPEFTMLTAVVTDASAQDCSTGVPFRVYFEYTTDNETTWRRGGALTLKASSAGIPLQVKSCPVGFLEILPVEHAAATIKWRVVVSATAVGAVTDDITVVVYLAFPTGFPAEQD